MNKDSFVNYIARYAPASQDKWWERPNMNMFGYPAYSYWEAFENPAPLKKDESESPLMDYPPNGPSPAEVYNEHPYHLLGDIMPPPSDKESLSKINSSSCYAADFEQAVAKTGNYRQTTNNYKRNYPDSCSGWNQELTLNFNRLEQTCKMLASKIEALDDKVVKLDNENKFYISCLSNAEIELGYFFTHTGCVYLTIKFSIPIKTEDLTINCDTFCHPGNSGDKRFKLENIKYLYKLKKLTFNNLDSITSEIINQLSSDTLIEILFNSNTTIKYIDCIKKCPNLRKLTIQNDSFSPSLIDVLSSYENNINNITIIKCSKINVVEMQNYCLLNKIKLNIT
jgi:hypothetical protein